MTQRYGLWAPLSLAEPLDVVFLLIAAPLVALVLRRRLPRGSSCSSSRFAVMSVEARRNGIWFLLFAATPPRAVVRRLAGTAPLRRVALACCAVPAFLAVAGLSRPVAPGGAGTPLLGGL